MAVYGEWFETWHGAQTRYPDKARWVTCFAYLPVRTRDVGWIWWRPYWRFDRKGWHLEVELTGMYCWRTTRERWLTPLGRAVMVKKYV